MSESASKTYLVNNGVGKLGSYRFFVYVALAIMAIELVGNLGIIQYIQYTNIDWDAYMEEVEGVVNGTYDYTLLKGDTGPLVYPAGFVYIFYGLYFLTDLGENVRLAQYIWMVLYLATLVVVLMVYKQGRRVPLWALFMLCISRRVHSIFVLRLFNDCWAVFLFFIALYLFTKDKWSSGCLFFSLAVSVKMNILLFAPALLLLLLKRFGLIGTIPKLMICAAPQVILAIPFLLVNPWGYIQRSFDLGRQFFYVWSVNWKFIPEHIFLHPAWGLGLLALTAIFIAYFWFFKWMAVESSFLAILQGKYSGLKINPDHIISLMFTSNFIGIVFARSLHFQFYVWYFFTLPYLMWCTKIPTPFKAGLLLVIEAVWNIFPSNAYTSSVLLCCHLIILVGLLLAPLGEPYVLKKKVE